MEEDKDRLGIQMESHDTIGMLALDTRGDLAGACTTSGVAWKVRGRVGDTPVIGAGLYVDNEVGAAAGTGRGELILQICGSFFVVEKLREGKTPQAACEAAVQRILSMRDKGQIKNPDGPTFQAGFIAVNSKGEYGAASIKKGFPHAVYRNGKNELIESRYFLND